ncbi:MAG: ribonuclease HII, partial [bacterium]
MNTTPDFSAEQNMLAQGKACIVGVDEVGRGPWAGPVVAAAVWIDPAKIPLGATDSKKLSAKKRDALAEIIWRDAKCSIAECSVEEVDKLNIREATFLAMERAV